MITDLNIGNKACKLQSLQEKMAPRRKRVRLEEAVGFGSNSDNSDCDASVGGLSSDEDDLDCQLKINGSLEDLR